MTDSVSGIYLCFHERTGKCLIVSCQHPPSYIYQRTESHCHMVCLCNVLVGNFRSLERHSKDGPEDMTALAKWRILNRLHDRNETLYYKVNLFLPVSSLQC